MLDRCLQLMPVSTFCMIRVPEAFQQHCGCRSRIHTLTIGMTLPRFPSSLSLTLHRPLILQFTL